MTQYNLLGVKINIIAEHLLKNTLVDFLNSRKQHQIVTVNPEFIVTAQKNKNFLAVLNQASISLIDGAGIIKALQYLGYDVSLDHRITGVRLNEILIDLAVNKNLKIMFCLYSQGLTNKQALSEVIKKQYPSLNWQIADENNALEIGQKFSPDIILVGYGAPWQNFWIAENIEKIPSAKIAAGVGGTFDFISGTIKRAPKLMQSLGLEWLWRLSLQPSRFSRIVRAVIVFPYLVYKNKGKK